MLAIRWNGSIKRKSFSLSFLLTKKIKVSKISLARVNGQTNHFIWLHFIFFDCFWLGRKYSFCWTRNEIRFARSGSYTRNYSNEIKSNSNRVSNNERGTSFVSKQRQPEARGFEKVEKGSWKWMDLIKMYITLWNSEKAFDRKTKLLFY
jgi:hypothetical protein